MSSVAHRSGKSPTHLMDHPGEADRLREKVDPAAWVKRHLPAIGTGGRVLEVGCGPMHLLDIAAGETTAALAVGVDLSEQRLLDGRTRTRSDGLGPVLADATALPSIDDAFDLSYTRFLLQYLPNPQRAVDELVRVTRPGGTVLLQDLDGQLLNHYPEDPLLIQALQALLFALRGRLDPFVGRKLFTFAQRAGLRALRVEMEPYHLIAGAADARTVHIWQHKFSIAMPTVIEALGRREAEAARRRFLTHLENPESVTFSTLFTIVGQVAPG